MQALNLFTRFAPNKTFVALILGLVSGLLYSMLIPIVMLAISTQTNSDAMTSRIVDVLGFEVSNWTLAVVFFTVCSSIILLSTLSEIILTRMALDIRSRLRRDIYQKVQDASIGDVDKVGRSSLLQALATDVPTIIGGAQALPGLVSNCVIVFAMLGYLSFLDLDIFYFVSKTVLCGSVIFLVITYFGNHYYKIARLAQDRLQAAFLAAVSGVKELKLSRKKYTFFEQKILLKEELEVRDLQKKGRTFHILANNFGDAMFFVTIGFISFILVNYYHFSNSELVAIVMVLLYLSGPISMILSLLPTLSIANISVDKLNTLFESLPSESYDEASDKKLEWKSLQLRNVEYKYNAQGGDNNTSDSFGIGPIDLSINAAEVTFIIGGNGSGKSTLAKVIAQLYKPCSGEVYFDNELVTEKNINTYRQGIVTIFSDYHLFPQVLMDHKEYDKEKHKLEKHLKYFGLEDKVSVDDYEFSTLDLSDGQRRRLALVIAMIDVPQLYIFDEWAADQDPEFKRVFYQDILPYLRSRGSAVLVISHDDRYFSHADKLVYVEDGKIASVEYPEKPEQLEKVNTKKNVDIEGIA
ncbi:cyclic peptide export ABC transporter [Pseudoalteromonas umbrosa]|uniref:cyclic peptide export ABC transporter n=1 Tax=Pseudoalteromonas umbrosa TaxID=3048489 RepID=UPI0024C253D5|nr:cyclic peptide export ABC transporter [Pseudoalteromonas sp. B95]MDK1288843.1 cyclic peptide export ABC transporter [Pseudoalteromonas sp. B95]